MSSRQKSFMAILGNLSLLEANLKDAALQEMRCRQEKRVSDGVVVAGGDCLPAHCTRPIRNP